MNDVALPRTTRVPGGLQAAGTVLGVVLGQPALWVLGGVGFLARGGIVLLCVPILTLPTPVGFTTILGPDAFDRGGFSSSFVAAVGPPLLVAMLASVAIALVAGAIVDLIAYERFMIDPESADMRDGRRLVARGRVARARIVVRLALLQALLLLPLGIAVAVLFGRVVAVARTEQLLPTALEVPLVVRIISGAAQPLLILLVTLVVCEMLYARTSRELLAARLTRVVADATAPAKDRRAPSARRPTLARLARTLATSLTGWLVTLAALGTSLWALGVAWTGVRSAFLGPSVFGEPRRLLEAAAVSLVFAALWSGALLVIGSMSAIRAALWTAQSLR